MICFGAGKALNNFINLFPEFSIEKNIFAIVDNDIKKEGSYMEIKDSKVQVISFAAFEKMNHEDVIMLITSLYFVEIYKQLTGKNGFVPYPCYIYRFIISESYGYFWKKRPLPAVLKRSEHPIIPKKIHYCWFGKNSIPEQNKKYIETWKKYCPDYEIIEWNEDNYDFSKNQYAYEAYKNKKWAFVSDVARLDIIYHHGGIYLDTDVEVLRNLDELLYQEGFLGTFYSGEVATGLGFGAVKGNRLIKELLEQYDTYEFSLKKGTKVLPLCVDYQTDYLKSKGYIVGKGYQEIDNVAIYTEEILENVCFDTRRKIYSENTFAIHHSDASWRDEGDQLLKKQRYEFWQQHFGQSM